MQRVLASINLPNEMQDIIYNYLINANEEEYWKDLYKTKFNKYILSKIDIKLYYKNYVLSEINKGWILVGINKYIFCDECNKYRQTQENCCNCSICLPCANCYWYGGCEYCAEQWEMISWNTMYGMIDELKKYRNYAEFRKENAI